MKRRLPAIVVLVGLLAVAGMATWLLRDTLARSVANYLLDGTGLHVTELAGFQPSFDETTVGELAVGLADSGRIQRFHDIGIDYSLTGLRNGQLQGIRIGRAELDRSGGAAVSGTAADVPRLTDLVQMIRQAPLQSLHIPDLRVDGRSLALRLRWQEDRLSGQLGDGETALHLELDWQPDRTGTTQPSSPAASPFEVRLRARTGEQAALATEIVVVPREGMLQVQASSDVDSGTAQPVIHALAAWFSLPLRDASALSISADIAVEATVPDALAVPRSLQLTVTGPHMAVTIPDIDDGTVRAGNAALTLNDYQLRCSSLNACEFSAGGALRADSVTLTLSDTASPDPMRLREPSLTLPAFEGSLADDSLQLRLSSGTILSIPEAELGERTARNTEATLRSTARLDFPLAVPEELRVQAGELSVALPVLRQGEYMAGLALRVRDLDSRPLDRFALDGEFHLSNAYTNVFSLNLWDATLTADITVADGIVGFDARVALNGHTAATMTGEHDLAEYTGQGVMVVPDVTFDDAGNSLSDFIDPLPLPVDLVAGTLGGEAELAWRLPAGEAVPVLTGDVDVELGDIAGFYEDVGFIGLDTRLRARLDENRHLQSVTDAPLRIGRLDVGFPIEDIEATYRLDSAGPAIEVREAGMTLFGGRITTDSLAYDARVPSSTSTLLLERIDMARILSLSAYEGITATGIVSGRIPLTRNDGQWTVSGGTIAALPPGGTISYRGGPTDSGNSSLDLVYSALRNYRYSLLEGDVDYRADGELLLAVRMEGVAPAIDDQRINLNVTIQDNIPSLLESLQAGRDIAESIRRQAGGEG